MAAVLDELVLALDIESKDFTAGEQAVHAALDRLTAAMERVADVFEQGQKQASDALAKTGSDADKAARETEAAGERTGKALKKTGADADKTAAGMEQAGKRTSAAITNTGKKAEKTAKGMEQAGKRASKFFSGIRTQILALAGVTLTLGGLKSLVTGFAGDLNQLSIASDAFGMKAKHLDGWIRAGQANGVDSGEMTGAFSRLANAQSNWKAGKAVDPVVAELFQTMARAGVGFNPDDSPEKTMRKLASIFPRLTKAEQMAYGNALGFSYAGQQFLGSGHALKDVDEFTSRSQVTPERIALARKLRKELVELDQTWSNIGMTIGTALMPYALEFSHWLEKLGDWMQQHPEEVNKFITGFLDKVESIASKANEAADAVGGWKNVIIALIGLKVASWVLGLTKALNGPGGLLFAITALYPVIDGLLTSLLGEKNKAWLSSHGLFWASDGTFFFDEKEGEAYQAKLDAGEKTGSTAQSPTTWQQGMLDTQATLNSGGSASSGPSWLQGMRETQEKLGNAMQNRPRPTKAGEALLGWLQPKLSQLEEKYNLPPGLLRSVAITESGGNQFAVSHAGAMGLFQFMPKTAKEFGLRGNDAFDPEKAADAAARKLGGLMRFFHGDLAKALAAYNWGEGNVQRKGLAAAPEETRNYVPRVLANLPQPGAAMAVQSRHPAPVSQSTVTETTHIGTLNVTTASDTVKGITDDARRRIRNSALVSAYSSGVTG
ncbi:lytic transglycosylase domain-containing protein [Salmonella enterica subsp. enterica]|nr:lytic transglycosylase domain-containing protein [Salmonella enterica subsp. enterica serovar Kambole]ECG3342251.1 lytic transglycosylase domain-containing protein [Salmonella enterica subsp. enterica serovar Kambole]ECO3184112.1 transglycosylase SLT domain-containing protein [Salmonella enterica subsp. enterica serovar Kambole]ECY5576960.1 transglycosylase SLT domain-containing protein [Salmonella enterica subsp. enterica serovar Kambole]EDN3629927.1 transglycosylase SLT domain-containing p